MEAYQKLCQEQSQMWECQGCTLMNNTDSIKCAACALVKDSNSSNIFGLNTENNKGQQQFQFGFVEEQLKNIEKSAINKKAKNANLDITKQNGSNTKMVEKRLVAKLRKISSGHTVLLVFGNNSFGSLGLGENADPVVKYPTLVPSSVQRNFRFIACGAFCCAAIDFNGQLWTWGPNDGGILGRSLKQSKDSECVPGLVRFPENSIVIKVSVGNEHMAALLKDGVVYSWGSFKNEHGRVGHHVENKKLVKIQAEPVRIKLPAEEKVIDLDSGANHIALLTESGKIFLLGITNFSKKTIYRKDSSLNALKLRRIFSRPVRTKFARVFCGNHTVYAFSQNNSQVFSMGLNNYGQLGYHSNNNNNKKNNNNNDKNTHFYSTTLNSISIKNKISLTAKKISAGNHHTLLLSNSRTLYSFGRNASGTLGVKTRTPSNTKRNIINKTITKEPCPSTDLLECRQNVLDICSGFDHNLYVMEDEKKEISVRGFGFNSDCRLGVGGEHTVEAGEEVTILSSSLLKKANCRVRQIAAGAQFSCVLVEKEEFVRRGKRKR